jgi:hypothetical protein
LFTVWVRSLSKDKPTPEGVSNFFRNPPNCNNIAINIKYSDILKEYGSIFNTTGFYSVKEDKERNVSYGYTPDWYFLSKIIAITKTERANVILDKTNDQRADFSVRLNQYAHNDDTSYYKFHFCKYDIHQRNEYICKISVESPVKVLSLQSLRIKVLEIDLSIFKGNIFINNCWVSEIRFINNLACQHGIDLNILNSYIRGIDLRNVFFDSLNIISSSLYYFSLPVSKDGNPFKGDVALSNTEILPTKPGHILAPAGGQIQSINNMIFYLEENKNFKVASYIKGYLKRGIRLSKKQKDCAYIIDYLFDTVSFYNVFPERILGIIWAFFVIFCAGIFTFDLSIINLQDPNIGVVAKFSRSTLLTFSSIFYPVGLWSEKAFVATNYSLVRVILAFYGLINYALFALFIIGLRKKYQQ